MPWHVEHFVNVNDAFERAPVCQLITNSFPFRFADTAGLRTESISTSLPMTTESLSSPDVEHWPSRNHVTKISDSINALLRTNMELQHRTRFSWENRSWIISRMRRFTRWKPKRVRHSSSSVSLQMVGRSQVSTGWSKRHPVESRPSTTRAWPWIRKGTCGSRTSLDLMLLMTRTMPAQPLRHSVTNTSWETESCWKSFQPATQLRTDSNRPSNTFHVVTKSLYEDKKLRYSVYMAGRRCLKRYGVKMAGL